MSRHELSPTEIFWFFVHSANAKTLDSDSGLSVTSERGKRSRKLSSKAKEAAKNNAQYQKYVEAVKVIPEEQEIYDDGDFNYTPGFPSDPDMET